MVVVLLGRLAAGGFDTTLNGGDVVARRMWVVVGRSVEFVATSLRWWLLVEEATSQGCDAMMFNTHVRSTNLWSPVWSYFKQVLLGLVIQSYPFSSIESLASFWQEN